MALRTHQRKESFPHWSFFYFVQANIQVSQGTQPPQPALVDPPPGFTPDTAFLYSALARNNIFDLRLKFCFRETGSKPMPAGQMVLPGKLSSFQRIIFFFRFCLFWAANPHTVVPQDWLSWEEDHSYGICLLDWKRGFSRGSHKHIPLLWIGAWVLNCWLLCQTLVFKMRWQEHLPPHNVYSLNYGAYRGMHIVLENW